MHSDIGCNFTLKVTFHKDDQKDKGTTKEDSAAAKAQIAKNGTTNNGGT